MIDISVATFCNDEKWYWKPPDPSFEGKYWRLHQNKLEKQIENDSENNWNQFCKVCDEKNIKFLSATKF